MRRILSSIVLVILLFLVTVLYTGINFLRNLEDILPALDGSAFSTGNVRQIFLTEHFWQAWPNLQLSPMFIFIQAAALSGLIVLAIYYFLGYKKKCQPICVGLACFAGGFIPYFTGKWLLYGNASPERCGWWVAFMLLGMLYCWIGSVLFVAFDIFKIDITKLMSRMSLHKPYLSWHGAVSQ